MAKEKKTAKDIVNENRKKIVDKIIKNMEKGYVFQEWSWNRNALLPHNALSNIKYQGINRLNLSFEAIEKGYKDPRWLTFKQATDKGYKVKSEAKGVLCEKWIWEKREKVKNPETGEIELDEEGNEKIVVDPLKVPKISFFYLFNASQIEGIPEYIEPQKNSNQSEIISVAEKFINSSECPIREVAQEKAYYSPREDKIILPPKEYFKSDEAFLGTLLHEMSHSTGSKERLDRDIINIFGTEKYAIEELTAELSCVFLEAELGLNIDFTRQDHINYFSSWIRALKDDPNELYKVCSNASSSCNRLMENYEKVIALEKEQNYNMLKRLRSECESYLHTGNLYDLYYRAVGSQIEIMEEIYNSFSEEEKPEWINLEDIKNYEKEMCKVLIENEEEDCL